MSLLTVLRDGTRDAHDRLERDLGVPSRCRDRDSYVDLLRSLRAVYAPLERQVELSPVVSVALPDWPARRKTAWLDEDLAALCSPPGSDASAAALPTAEDVIGACYVMEGATLGGALLEAEIGELLPRRFFASYGPRRGRMWRDFRCQVDGLAGLDTEAAVASARRTFALFELSCCSRSR